MFIFNTSFPLVNTFLSYWVGKGVGAFNTDKNEKFSKGGVLKLFGIGGLFKPHSNES